MCVEGVGMYRCVWVATEVCDVRLPWSWTSSGLYAVLVVLYECFEMNLEQHEGKPLSNLRSLSPCCFRKIYYTARLLETCRDI